MVLLMEPWLWEVMMLFSRTALYQTCGGLSSVSDISKPFSQWCLLQFKPLAWSCSFCLVLEGLGLHK